MNVFLRLGHVFIDLARHRVAQGHNHDNGGYTDDNPDHGQEGPHLVGHNG